MFDEVNIIEQYSLEGK